MLYLHGMLVYCVFNRTNDKYYVGQTTQPLHRRWAAHVSAARRNSPTYLHRAIRKHGLASFDVFVLAYGTSLQQLNLLEDLWIVSLQSFRRALGYNGTASNHSLCAEARKRMAASKRGVPLSAETKEKIRGAHAAWSVEAKVRWRGHSKSPITHERMSKAALGNTRRTGIKATTAQKENYRSAALAREAAKREMKNGANT